jgi:hypothetical protein
MMKSQLPGPVDRVFEASNSSILVTTAKEYDCAVVREPGPAKPLPLPTDRGWGGE